MLAETVLENGAASLSTIVSLKVTGKINEADWTCVKNQMTRLKYIDLSEATADFDYISHDGLYGISLPKGIKCIGSFRNVMDIKLNDDLEEIGSRAFYENTDLTSIELPESVKEIGYEAFYWSAIESVDLSKLKKCHFSRAIFWDCGSLKSVVLPDDMESIPYRMFFGCETLSSIVLPKSLKSIEEEAFSSCQSLTNVNLPNDLLSIGAEAFSGCDNLSDLVLPQALESIGKNAFEGCSSLTELNFPETLQTIGSNAFGGCSGLKKVTSMIPFPIAASGGLFSGIDVNNCTLVVPEWSALLYKMAMGWSEFAKIETVPSTELSLMTVTDKRELPASVRPIGTPDVNIKAGGSLSVRGETAFPMDEVVLNAKINQGGILYGWGENDEFYYYYESRFQGAVLHNDNSNLSVKSAKMGIESVNAVWGFIALPFDANTDDITYQKDGDETKYIWKTYDGARRALVGSGGNWTEVTGELKAGVGYIYQSQDSTAIMLKATGNTAANIVNKQDVKVTLNEFASDDAEDAGWNFIGNPYPTYFDTKYIDHSGSITVWNGKAYDAVSLSDDSYTLCPYEAFFVQCLADKTELTFHSEGRTTEAPATNNSYNVRPRTVQGEKAERRIVNLYLTDGKYTDRSRIVLNEKAAMGYEAENDASKFFGDSDVPQLYSLGEKGEQYAINERPCDNGVVRLGFSVPREGSYIIKGETDIDAYLIDKENGNATNLRLGDYSFKSGAITTGERFELHLSDPATGVDGVIANTDIHVSTSGNMATIAHSQNCGIEVYTVGGALVGKTGAKTFTLNLPAGAYIVKVGNSVRKVIIR